MEGNNTGRVMAGQSPPCDLCPHVEEKRQNITFVLFSCSVWTRKEPSICTLSWNTGQNECVLLMKLFHLLEQCFKVWQVPGTLIENYFWESVSDIANWKMKTLLPSQEVSFHVKCHYPTCILGLCRWEAMCWFAYLAWIISAWQFVLYLMNWGFQQQ